MFDIADISPLKIMLIDDHLMFAQGITELLNKISPDNKISVFTSVEKAKLELAANDYQFILSDLMIPGSNVKEFVGYCTKKYPGVYIIIISSITEINTIKELLAEGVHGYLSKAVNYFELKIALEKVYQGERYISSDLSGKMATSYFEAEKTDLTKKELEILRMVAAGKTVIQTAEALLISPSTVMAHRRNIMAKLDLHSAAELVKYAFENKLV